MSYGGASEMHGLTFCRGDQWLAHPGTIGLPMEGTEVEILDADGVDVPTGEIGGIYMRTAGGPGASYVGENVAPMTKTADGFVTVGDLGWLDEEGYLYIADRRVDMIITGGANVYPAEVEAALSEHPQIRDVVVVGVARPRVGAAGSTPSSCRRTPPIRRTRLEVISLRQGAAGLVQGSQDDRVHRLLTPHRRHEAESRGAGTRSA